MTLDCRIGPLQAGLVLCASCPSLAQDYQWKWNAVGTDSFIGALVVFDDGAGPALFAAGGFAHIGGVAAARVAKFDGQMWAPVGDGLSGAGVYSSTIHDDGLGPALYLGGVIHSAGGLPAKNVVKWNGHAWNAVGDGISGEDFGVVALASVPGQEGDTLYAAGYFHFAGGQPVEGIVKLVGNHWMEVPGPYGVIEAMATFNDGSGPALYAGGVFEKIGGHQIRNLAKWDTIAWADPGAALSYPSGVRALRSRVEEDRPVLYFGGFGDKAGSLTINGVCRWDGTNWRALGEGLDAAGSVWAFESYPSAKHELLIAGGTFESSGNIPLNRIAAWDGQAWAPLADGVSGADIPSVASLASVDFGDGPVLFVGGWFEEAGGLYSPNLAMVRCVPICIADCNDSGTIDLADFACFQSSFAAGDLKADCDHSGTLDLFDFLCFLNAFNDGCP